MNMNESLLLATTAQDMGRGRRCGIWVSPLVTRAVVLDTRAIHGDEALYAGPDTFPEDAVLVVVSPAENERLRQSAATIPYPVSGPSIAAAIIDIECDRDPELGPRLGWALK